jgi:hypothetical protein
MDAVEVNKQKAENDVLTLTIYKQEPECLSYIYRVRSVYKPGDPEHLEQLILMENVVDRLKTEAEHGCLQKYLDINREARMSFAKEREAKGVDSGSTGGESKPD